MLASHFEDPYHRGACDRPTHAGEFQDAVTCHWVGVQLRVDDDNVVTDAWFDAAGCLFCEAPASLLMEFCEGRSIVELKALSEEKFVELTHLAELRQPPPACCGISLHALQAALGSHQVDDEVEGLPGFGGPSLSEEV